MNTRPGSTRLVPRLAALALLLSIVPAPAVRAQTVIHVPPMRGASAAEEDSIPIWTAQAKAAFQANQGDSALGENFRPYQNVGFIGRRLLRSLGHRSLQNALAIKPALDSLGFSTDVANDPTMPTFALLMVRNPARFTADAVGFLYWYMGGDLRIQGLVFKGGYHPRMRVWQSGVSTYPFEWGILDDTRDRQVRFTLLRLNPVGTAWAIQQDEESILPGGQGEAAWVDLNQDGPPEFVSWTHGVTDSLFTECPGCPKLLTERTFIERGDGFGLLDERLLPTPYAALVYFVRLLIDGKLAQAEKLVRVPAMVHEAIAQGWNKRVVRQPWFVQFGESGASWPFRLALRFEGPQGPKDYGVVFTQRDGHWIIDRWFEPREVARRFPSVTMPPAAPATPARPPAKKAPVRSVVPPAKSR